QMFDELQCRAYLVRAGNGLWCRSTEDGKHKPTYRVRRELAVCEEVVEGLIGRLPLVEAICFDEPKEGLHLKRARVDRGLQATKERMRGATVERRANLPLGPIERLDAVAVVLIPEIIHKTAKAIDVGELS